MSDRRAHGADVKTTLAGYAAAAALALQTVLQQGGSILDWKTWLAPVLVAILGHLTADRKPSNP